MLIIDASKLKNTSVLLIAPVIEQRVAKQIITLHEIGCKITVICSKILDYLSSSIKYEEVKIKTFPYIINPQVLDPYMNYTFRKVLNSCTNNYDLVLFRDILLFEYFHKFVVKKFPLAKIVIDIADNYEYVAEDIYHLFNPKRHILKKNTFKGFNSSNKADGIIVVCKENALRISKKYGFPLNKLKVVQNSPLKEVNNLNSDIKNKKQNSIVYSGRIDNRIRDFFTVVKAINKTNWKLILYITNPKSKDVKSLRKFIKKNSIKKNIELKDPVDFKNTIEAISKYCFGLVPHRNINTVKYTLPNKIYDYIQSELPVITSNVEILNKFICKRKIGFSYNDENDLVVKLNNISLDEYKTFLYNIKSIKERFCFEKEIISALTQIINFS